MLDLSPEVSEALQMGRPLVALESTIITHGMPYPQNLETALRVEQVVRDHGAVPATLALLQGRMKAGLSRSDLELLATDPHVIKASTRDLPLALLLGQSAGTTVAATMLIASLAGIRVFATGGVGGVHRGAELNFDISADLSELARTPVAVVSAGVKSILDLPLTLEYLETQGVPVIGVGTDEFPAFYTRQSGLPVPARLDTPDLIARFLELHWSLGRTQGALIANPIPQAWSMDPQRIERVISQALEEAQAQQVSGKALTPFLLARIKDLTAGESLVSNIELVCHNAALAAQISRAYLNPQSY